MKSKSQRYHRSKLPQPLQLLLIPSVVLAAAAASSAAFETTRSLYSILSTCCCFCDSPGLYLTTSLNPLLLLHHAPATARRLIYFGMRVCPCQLKVMGWVGLHKPSPPHSVSVCACEVSCHFHDTSMFMLSPHAVFGCCGHISYM